MKRILLTLLAIITFAKLPAQQMLSPEEFLSVIRLYHPVAKQAALEVKIAEAEVTAARGGFDPVIQSEIGKKSFDGVMYYHNRQHQLKIPTWYGVDIEAGIQTLSGNRTSRPETLGESSFIGLTLPVGQNLLMDKRRAVLMQARIYRDQSAEVQRQIINQLLFDASVAYWNWWEQYQLKLLFEEASRNAIMRLRMVTTAFEIGERPAIDTTEALTQWQSFQLRQQEIDAQLANALLDVQLYLWTSEGEPFSAAAPVPPANLSSNELQPLIDLLQQSVTHPQLAQYPFKLKALEVERRLKFQSLLPLVNLKYNQLSKSHNPTKGLTQPLFDNNFRYGVQLAVPLRLSEGRGEYRAVKFKIEQLELEQLNKQVALQTKLKQYYNEWLMLRRQIELQQKAILAFEQLLRGEELRFTNGESSLFLVNAREQKTLEAKQKLIELKQKAEKARVAVLWAAGSL